MATLQINVSSRDVHLNDNIHKDNHWVGQINDIYCGEPIHDALQKLQNQICLLEGRVKELEDAYVEHVLLGKADDKK